MNHSLLQDPNESIVSSFALTNCTVSHTIDSEKDPTVLLREWFQNTLHSLFIAKGFCEELQTQIASRRYLKSNFDHDNFADVVEALGRNVERVEGQLRQLQKTPSAGGQKGR